jgi:hypothetical protein
MSLLTIATNKFPGDSTCVEEEDAKITGNQVIAYSARICFSRSAGQPGNHDWAGAWDVTS